MSRFQVRVKAEAVVNIEAEDYADSWQEHCDDQGGREEDDEYPPVTEEFALEKFQEDLESGDADLGEVFENAVLDVQRVE